MKTFEVVVSIKDDCGKTQAKVSCVIGWKWSIDGQIGHEDIPVVGAIIRGIENSIKVQISETKG